MTSDPYQVRIGGVIADPYRIARAYGLDATLGAALKKLLRRGRKHKDLAADIRETITTLQRWQAMEAEDACFTPGDPAMPCAICGQPMIRVRASDFDGWSCMATPCCVYRVAASQPQP